MPDITALNIDNFSRTLNAPDSEAGVAVIYFSASWCQPCQSMKPVFEKIAAQIGEAGVVSGTVDMAESPTIAQTYGIKSVPSIAIFRHAQLAKVIAGDMSFDKAMAQVQQALAYGASGH
ncbi:thioredoxin family protein [Chitinivorax sp. PXF-14]|uniref:thioredoxin family protein n=1 Tax=Chitinivorax sp. PXF-14 TaxID=3230488 RepID=UPI0034672540